MDRDNKREITISIPEPIYEELQNAAKQLSGWEREQIKGIEREISDSWEAEDEVQAFSLFSLLNGNIDCWSDDRSIRSLFNSQRCHWTCRSCSGRSITYC